MYYMHLYASICIYMHTISIPIAGQNIFSPPLDWLSYGGPLFLGSFWPPFILRIHHRTMCIHMPHIFTSHLGHSPELGPRSNLDSCQPLENLRPFGLPENMVPRNPLVGHQFPHSMAGHLEGMLYSQRDIPWYSSPRHRSELHPLPPGPHLERVFWWVKSMGEITWTSWKTGGNGKTMEQKHGTKTRHRMKYGGFPAHSCKFSLLLLKISGGFFSKKQPAICTSLVYPGVFFSLQYNRRDILGMALDGPGCFYMLNEVFIYTTYGSIEYI